MEAIKNERQGSSVLLLALRAFFRHKTVFAAVFLACLSLIGAYTGLTKRKYRSEMKFIVQSARSNAVISPDHTESSLLQSVSEEQLNSELEILQSEDVLSKVADRDWGTGDPQKKSRKEIKEHSARMSAFIKNLTVDPIRKADVMSLSYLAASPEEARDSLAQLASAYLAQHERLQRPSGTSGFYAEETNRYQREWNIAVQNLVTFQQIHHLVSVPEVEEKLQKAIADDEEALRVNQVKLGENAARLDKAATVLDQVSPRQETQRRAVPSQILVQQLKTQLVGLKNRRTELMTRYTASDRLVIEVDKQIADTSLAIETAIAEENIEKTTDVNPAWQQLKTIATTDQVEYQSLKGGQTSLRGELAALQLRLAEVQSLAPEFEQLRSGSEQAQANYEAFQQKRERAQLEDAMDARKLLNVSIMQSPTLPYKPAQPKPVLNFILGLPTALLVALAVLYFLEAGRTTFATPAELEAALPRPVLATIPYEENADYIEKRPSLAASMAAVSLPRRREYQL